MVEPQQEAGRGGERIVEDVVQADAQLRELDRLAQLVHEARARVGAGAERGGIGGGGQGGARGRSGAGPHEFASFQGVFLMQQTGRIECRFLRGRTT
jgi:hypothetical protein